MRRLFFRNTFTSFITVTVIVLLIYTFSKYFWTKRNALKSLSNNIEDIINENHCTLLAIYASETHSYFINALSSGKSLNDAIDIGRGIRTFDGRSCKNGKKSFQDEMECLFMERLSFNLTTTVISTLYNVSSKTEMNRLTCHFESYEYLIHRLIKDNHVPATCLFIHTTQYSESFEDKFLNNFHLNLNKKTSSDNSDEYLQSVYRFNRTKTNFKNMFNFYQKHRSVEKHNEFYIDQPQSIFLRIIPVLANFNKKYSMTYQQLILKLYKGGRFIDSNLQPFFPTVLVNAPNHTQVKSITDYSLISNENFIYVFLVQWPIETYNWLVQTHFFPNKQKVKHPISAFYQFSSSDLSKKKESITSPILMRIDKMDKIAILPKSLIIIPQIELNLDEIIYLCNFNAYVNTIRKHQSRFVLERSTIAKDVEVMYQYHNRYSDNQTISLEQCKSFKNDSFFKYMCDSLHSEIHEKKDQIRLYHDFIIREVQTSEMKQCPLFAKKSKIIL
ncbi:hypothetical protein SNEBB_000431 [Seison nebaliae]|nr:hypothetical protein SNEBB_000431 [Seison nebaliae]